MPKNLNISEINIVVITEENFNKKIKYFRISSLSPKLQYLKNLKVVFVFSNFFDIKFSKTLFTNFIKEILRKEIKPRFIYVANN